MHASNVTSKDHLIEIIFDSWDRNNRILTNLLQAVPEGGLEARAMPASKSVVEMFTHMNYVRLIFLVEDAPEFALTPSPREWLREWLTHSVKPTDIRRLTEDLNASAKAVRDAVNDRIRSGQPMNRHYDHPLFFLQHMIWHEGYHHGQIKLALKVCGHPFRDEEIGPLTWGLWLNKTSHGIGAD